MARAVKWLLIAVGLVVGVVAAAVVAILLLFDPNDYKDEIAAAVERHTGRKLTIEGDIGLTFFPWLGLQLGRSQLADAPGFGAEPFLALDGARLAVQLTPLLQRRVVLDKIVVDGLAVRLVRNESGRANWEELIERFQREEAAPAEPAEPSAGEGGPAVTLERLGGFELNAATLVYEDRVSGARYVLDPLELQVAELDPARPIPVKARWSLSGKDLPQLVGELSGRVSFDQANQRLSIPDLALNVTARGEAVPAGELVAALKAAVEGDLKAQRYVVPRLTLETLGLTVQGEAEAELPAEGPWVNAKLTVPEFNPRQLMQRLAIDPPQTADQKALTTASLQTAIRYAGTTLRISELLAKLDGTVVQGEATLRSFSPVAASFNLVVDQINLDRYLPPERAQGGGQRSSGQDAPAAGGQEQAKQELPMETLRQLDLDGTLRVGLVTVKGLKLEQLKAQLRAKGGDIRLEPMSAELYQGNYAGAVRLDARGSEPVINLNQRLSGVQSGPLLQDLIGEPKILGNGNVIVSGTMRGHDGDAMLRSLDGEASFQFTDGAINGINIARSIRMAQARLTGQSLSEEQRQDQRTDFSALGGTLVFKNGVGRNDDLSLQSPLMRITGKGELNLPAQQVDYLLTVNLVGTLAGQGGEELEQLKRIPIPLRIRGPFADPGVTVDLAEALRQSQGEKIKEVEEKAKARLEEERKQLEEKAKEKVQDRLQNLLRR